MSQWHVWSCPGYPLFDSKCAGGGPCGKPWSSFLHRWNGKAAGGRAPPLMARVFTCAFTCAATCHSFSGVCSTLLCLSTRGLLLCVWTCELPPHPPVIEKSWSLLAELRREHRLVPLLFICIRRPLGLVGTSILVLKPLCFQETLSSQKIFLASVNKWNGF